MNARALPYPKIGDRVKVVQKKDYATGKLTEGVVKEVLTKQKDHPRGTKVKLEDGVIGRIQEFVDDLNSRGIELKKPKPEIIYIEDEEALV